MNDGVEHPCYFPAMNRADEIKAAALNLPPADKLDLYRKLDGLEEIQQWRRAELKREIQKGIDSLERGDFTEHDERSLDTLSSDIKARGRERLRSESA
jgi:hypothetical protein